MEQAVGELGVAKPYVYCDFHRDGRLPPDAMVRELSKLAWRVIGLRSTGRRR